MQCVHWSEANNSLSNLLLCSHGLHVRCGVVGLEVILAGDSCHFFSSDLPTSVGVWFSLSCIVIAAGLQLLNHKALIELEC